MKGQFIQIGLVAIAMMASVAGSVRAETATRIAQGTECDTAVQCLRLGNQLAQNGNYSGAVSLYNRAISLDRSQTLYQSLTWYNWGLSLQKDGDCVGAIRMYTNAISNDRGWGTVSIASAHNNQGICHARIGQYNRALEALENAVQAANSDEQRQQYQQNLEIVEQLVNN